MRNRKDNERGHEMFVVPCEESKDKRDEFAKTEYQVMHRLASTSVKVVYVIIQLTFNKRENSCLLSVGLKDITWALSVLDLKSESFGDQSVYHKP